MCFQDLIISFPLDTKTVNIFNQFELTLAGEKSHKFFALDILKAKLNIKMELFETASKNFWILGMEWDESTQKFVYSIIKNFYAYCVSIMCITLTTFYLIYDAQRFEEYTEALFVCTTAVMCSIITTFIAIKLDVFSEFIKASKTSHNERKLFPIVNHWINNKANDDDVNHCCDWTKKTRFVNFPKNPFIRHKIAS